MVELVEVAEGIREHLDFWKENDLVGSQGDLRALGHPQRPQQAQLSRVQQVPVMIIKIWHGTCLFAIFQRQIDLKRSQPDTGWSRWSRTPSATPTRSTMTCTASTSNFNPKIDMVHVHILFSMKNRFKLIPGWSLSGPLIPSANSASSTMAS